MDPNVSVEERNVAYKFCKEHLYGAWKEVACSDLKICKLSGGMSNLLYYCALMHDLDTKPNEVLLRIYGPTHSDTEVQLEIFNQLAAENLGPKLYGEFKEGRLEEYLPSNPLTSAQLTSDEISRVVVQKIAAIHKLKVNSLDRNSNWLIDRYKQYNNFLEGKQPIFSDINLETTRGIALELTNIDFEQEIEYMNKLIQSSNAPLVFSHNDLHQNNILLLQRSDKDQSLDDRIVLIDFEYCSYNYRTFDVANYLSEWCFNYTGDEYPYFSASSERFPSEAKQKQILEHYASQFSDTDNDQELVNSKIRDLDIDAKVNVLFEEMQPFLMASNLLWALWAINSAYTSKIDFGYWEMAKYKWEIYLLCKKRFDKKSELSLGCAGDMIVQSPKM